MESWNHMKSLKLIYLSFFIGMICYLCRVWTSELRFGPSGAQAFVQDKVVDLGGTGTHPEQPSPTGYKGIPFIVG